MTQRIRIYVRCDTCKYPTSKAKREGSSYGPCPRCVGVLRPCQPKGSATLTVEPIQKHHTLADAINALGGYTWPELVAMELQRQEDEQ